MPQLTCFCSGQAGPEQGVKASRAPHTACPRFAVTITRASDGIHRPQPAHNTISKFEQLVPQMWNHSPDRYPARSTFTKAPSSTRAQDSAPVPTTGGPHHKDHRARVEEAVDVERSPYTLNPSTCDGMRWAPDARSNSSPAVTAAELPIARARDARRTVTNLAGKIHPAASSTMGKLACRASPNCTSLSLAPSALPYFSTPQPQTSTFELAHRTKLSGGSGIALRLPRRVRRRVGDLPFEWLREIARRSGRTKESSSESESDADEEPQKISVKTAVPVAPTPKRQHTSRRLPSSKASSGERARSPSRAPSRSPTVPEFTVPVTVGAEEVRVRVAGFTEAMDVDGERKQDGPAGKEKTAAQGGPSWPSSSTSTSGDAPPVAGKDWESSSSDSSPIPSRPATRSTDLSGESTARSTSYLSAQSTSPPSSHTGSSGSLSAAVAKQAAHMTLSKKEKTSVSPSPSSGEVEVDGKLRSPDHARHSHSQRQSDAEAHVSRLDTWRSAVRPADSPPHAESRSSKSSDTTAPAGGLADEEGTVHGEGSQYQRGRVFDYTQPRRLHTDMSPPLLSTYDEPIRRVIEDMREQRMSLCQSLRQYVFVYRAVIEGTLMIVDEERKAEELGHRQDVFMDGPMHSPETVSSVGSGASLRERGVSRKRSISDYMREDAAIDGHLSMSPGGTKRGASPTELPKEGVQGEAMLTKRPSIKRTSRMDTV
ncbi:uncharacterized protein B0H18DRAFT_1124780 [Fomitopsis serialis]|uniref:uncharacterized protein n=1 Tax=Fomitopsis serialis TaxID=139415 RepID=UPI0020080625|nr:uncharacterized protein B0H18DRAFT_1124780 [Neoantrodia serialis]KAH9915641.1 hypothetical protein B0H18DRAFT_1124780 [Neoantrodia serialis]